MARYVCSAAPPHVQVRSDVLVVQVSLLEEISHLGSDLGELCVRRSHALTLSSRGLSATKGLGGLEAKVQALEASDIKPCEHEQCAAETGVRRRQGALGSAIVST